MKNLVLTILFCSISFLLGTVLGHKEAKKETYPKNDLTELTAKLDSLEAKKDTVINHYETNITNEKKIINNNFMAIDSLSYDSAYLLWSSEARYYKPIFN